MKNKIYKLEYNNEVIYVGKTITSLKQRKSIGYKYIPFYKECEIILIEETEDVSRERYWIEYYKNKGCNLYNIRKGDGFNRKEYDNDNKEYKKEYRELNKENLLKQKKEYYIENKNDKLKYQNEYYLKNKERIKQYRKEYYLKNKEKLKEYQKEYDLNKKK